MTIPSTPVRTEERHGWAKFVAVYLMIAGVLNVLWGIAALADKSYFSDASLLWSALSFWGWVSVILGILQLAGGALILAGRAGGAIIAGTLAFFGILVNFLSIGAYPIWSVILLVVNFLIIWAVTAHGEEFVIAR